MLVVARTSGLPPSMLPSQMGTCQRGCYIALPVTFGRCAVEPCLKKRVHTTLLVERSVQPAVGTHQGDVPSPSQREGGRYSPQETRFVH